MEKLPPKEAQTLHEIAIGSGVSSNMSHPLIQKGYAEEKLGGLALTLKGKLYEASKGMIILPEGMN